MRLSRRVLFACLGLALPILASAGAQAATHRHHHRHHHHHVHTSFHHGPASAVHPG